MRRIGLAVVATIAAMAAPYAAAASDRSDVIAAVQGYNDAGNKGDRAGYASYCTPDAIVVDQVEPFVFQGPTACAQEYDAVVAWGVRNKIAAEELYQKVYEPVSFRLDGDTAYAVFPVKGWFKQDGRPQVETLYLTTVLRRQAQGWRIQGLVYSTLGWKPSATPPDR